jgi:hypothetical protein
MARQCESPELVIEFEVRMKVKFLASIRISLEAVRRDLEIVPGSKVIKLEPSGRE